MAHVLFAAGAVALFLILWMVLLASGPAVRPLLPRVAHWTASFRYRDFLPVFVLIAAGIALAIVAGDGFLDIAERVYVHSPQLEQIDTTAHTWARTNRTNGATHFFTLMTVLGNPASLGFIVCVTAGVLVLKRRWHWLTYFLVTCGGGGLLNLQLKTFFARSRPDLTEALRRAHGYSFPSGHAMGSMVVFGALAYLAFRVVGRWRWRSAAIALSITLAVSIAASRVYLGVHWISDVSAGIVAGLLWLAATTVGYETFRRIRLIRSLRAKRS